MSAAKERDTIKIGTRKSPLAMVQTEFVVARLKEQHPELKYEIIASESKGDKILDKPLAEIGDKGLFTQDLEDKMHSGEVDIAVHSCKDLQTKLPEGLIIGCFLKRDPKEDVLITKKESGIKTLDDLPDGSVVGTSSLRRRAVLAHFHPNLKFKDIRGNIGTRLAKLDDDANGYDATILAHAGLLRMNDPRYEERITQVLPEEKYMYAVAQGILAVECRSSDEWVKKILSSISHELTTQIALAERALLRGLEGGCHVPIAVRVTCPEDDKIKVSGAVFSLNGAEKIEASHTGPISESEKIGHDLSQLLFAKGAKELLEKK
eukprot:TRINITY_DN2810_c0_g1_i5.p1 TRINITY_DN2810_c0_g1~~TRINITY_DN2810_c0_g1_i5.p1  ORF type:complete len:335 (+),score=67.24 TRINITY_DN2810_c0_g1_i5:48-1007(+)